MSDAGREHAPDDEVMLRHVEAAKARGRRRKVRVVLVLVPSFLVYGAALHLLGEWVKSL